MTAFETIQNYDMPEPARRLIIEHPPLVLEGPMGVGKTTLSNYLSRVGNYAPCVSDTTRAPRPIDNGDEIDGVHYHFINEAEVERKVHENAYIEVKTVHGDTIYGTTIAAYEKVVNIGRTPILDIDVQGVEEIAKIIPGFRSIFLLPTNFGIWEERLDGRRDMTLEKKLKRLGTAIIEFTKPIEQPENFVPVVNVDVKETADIIMSGDYMDPHYQARAFTLLSELQHATQDFLDQHAS